MPAKTQREVAAICRYVAGAIGVKAPITIAQAAETCGRSGQWLSAHLVANDLPRLNSGWGKRPNKQEPAAKRAKAIAAYHAGATLREAGHVVGATHESVRQWILASGGRIRGRSGRPIGSKDKAPRKRRGRPSHER